MFLQRTSICARVGFLALGFALMAFAQGDRGTITGTVSDPAGAVVPNAPVQATHVETGTTYDAATTSTGNYTLSQLPAGTYAVTVAVSGFKKAVREGLTVEVAQTLRIDFSGVRYSQCRGSSSEDGKRRVES
jgi:hypothetical protein